MKEVLDLGFGKCRLQVQVPEQGDINESKQLVGKKVYTSFTGLTRQYFRDLEAKHIQNKVNGDEIRTDELKTKIKRVGGSVEAAVSAGAADGVVDLVGNTDITPSSPDTDRNHPESGETMKAAELKAIDTVFESTAVLIRSKRVSNEKLVNMIASRISGVISLCSASLTANLWS